VALLEVRDLSKTFAGRRGLGDLEVLSGISLDLEEGGLTCVVGPSGCGKTTLLRIVAGLEPASSGQVLLEGERIEGPGSRVGLVFQQFALFPWRTVLRNVTFGLEMQDGAGRAERDARAMRYLELVGLAGFARHYPRELSGGMQQRVAIARTLVVEPRLLLMDEPFGSLDAQSRNSLQEFLVELWGKAGLTILFVTHSVDEAVFLGRRVVALSARPASVHETYEIPLDYPRDRTSAECVDIRRDVLTFLASQPPL
jgi:NitT/TauT family transport system ATP-binding protein